MNELIVRKSIDAIKIHLAIIEKELNATGSNGQSAAIGKVADITILAFCEERMKGPAFVGALLNAKASAYSAELSKTYETIGAIPVSLFAAERPSAKSLMGIRGVGKRSLERLREKLSEAGFSWNLES